MCSSMSTQNPSNLALPTRGFPSFCLLGITKGLSTRDITLKVMFGGRPEMKTKQNRNYTKKEKFHAWRSSKMVQYTTKQKAKNDTVSLCGCCGCLQTVAGLYLVLQQWKLESSKQSLKIRTGLTLHRPDLRDTDCHLCIGHALLRILLIIATIERKEVLKYYPSLSLESGFRLLSSGNSWLVTGGMGSGYIIPRLGIGWFLIGLDLVWTFIKTDYNNTSDPNQPWMVLCRLDQMSTNINEITVSTAWAKAYLYYLPLKVCATLICLIPLNRIHRLLLQQGFLGAFS